MKEQNTLKKGERGNVLFLILIAVALFAALSYAVTQSTRSGTGSTNREQSLLSSAAMTQFPTALRTAVIRMVLSGTDAGALEFDSPAATEADFPGAPNDVGRIVRVFDAQGGGALYQEAPVDLVTGTAPVPWTYNMNIQIPNLGTTSNELIAYLPTVTNSICVQLNRELDIDTAGCTMNENVPTATLGGTGITAAEIDVTMDDTYDQDAAANTNTEILTTASCTNGNPFDGQASGCFYDGTRNVFYSVLLER